MSKKENKFLTFSWVIFLFMGLLLISDSYTGHYLTDFPDKDVCLNDFDCVTPEVCCNFYGEDSGICDLPQNCVAIESATEEKVIGSASQIAGNAPSPLNYFGLGINTLYLFMGTLLIALSIIGFIYSSKERNK